MSTNFRHGTHRRRMNVFPNADPTATNNEKVAHDLEQKRRAAAIVAAHERRAASLAANTKAVRDALAARAARAAANVSPRSAKIAAKQAKARPTKKSHSTSRKMMKKHFSAHPHRFTRIPISTRRNRQ